MLTISQPVAREIQKLSSEGCILFLFSIPEHGLYLVRDLQNFTYQGQVYLCQPALDIGVLNLNSDGKFPELVLRIYDPSGEFEVFMAAHDDFQGADATFSIVNSLFPDEDVIYSITFEVKQPHVEGGLVDIKLGIDNPIKLVFPPRIMHPDTCQYLGADDFKGEQCGYTGAATSCDHRWLTCVSLGNQQRFGGCPGIIGTILGGEDPGA